MSRSGSNVANAKVYKVRDKHSRPPAPQMSAQHVHFSLAHAVESHKRKYARDSPPPRLNAVTKQDEQDDRPPSVGSQRSTQELQRLLREQNENLMGIRRVKSSDPQAAVVPSSCKPSQTLIRDHTPSSVYVPRTAQAATILPADERPSSPPAFDRHDAYTQEQPLGICPEASPPLSIFKDPSPPIGDEMHAPPAEAVHLFDQGQYMTFEDQESDYIFDISAPADQDPESFYAEALGLQPIKPTILPFLLPCMADDDVWDDLSPIFQSNRPRPTGDKPSKYVGVEWRLGLTQPGAAPDDSSAMDTSSSV